MSDIYDSVFRTILNDCSRLIIPIINITFGEAYTGDERIEFFPNEHFIDRQNEPDQKRITDTNFAIYGRVKKTYHWECQSTPDSKMLIRLFEYDAQIALDSGEVNRETLTVEFPNTAVIYLRCYKTTTPDVYRYVIKTPGGIVEYDVPILKTQKYTLEEIFEKELILLIPFYIFSREADFAQYESNSEKLEALKDEYREIIDRLDKLVQDEKLSDFDRNTLIETAEDVINEIAKKYENLRKGIGDVMGGAILDTNARRILNQGRAEGRAEGRVEGIADMTISLLEDIGEVPEALSKIIYEQNDINILEKWHKTAAKAKSIEEFEQKIGLVEK